MSDTTTPAPRAGPRPMAPWLPYVLEGAILIVLGIAAIAVPFLASLAAAVILGWLLIVGGVAGLAGSFMDRSGPGFGWGLASSVLAIVAGVLLAFWPVGGAAALTLVLAGFLAADGVFSLGLAFSNRRASARGWPWLVLNAIIDFALVAVILWNFPALAVWVLGLFLGVDLLFGGVALLVLGLARRRPAPLPG